MNVAGIICEYNPFHMGHAEHIKRTREALGGDSAIVCVMSGNFVQRGEPAIFRKHARAETAVRCGADLVVELPLPYALSSAEGFAAAGVRILDSLGICGYLSFGSESGDTAALGEVAEAIVTAEAYVLTKEWLGKGIPYAAARQKAADALLGERAEALKSPNDLLGVEYLKAIAANGSALFPLAIKRTGAAHGSDTGCSATAIRRALLEKRDACANVISAKHIETEAWNSAWTFVPQPAADIYIAEIAAGRGPVSVKDYEQAVLSRLRAGVDFSNIPGASEGLDRRFLRYSAIGPTIDAILESVKTKRYAMSRLRRMLMCASLGVTNGDSYGPPPYIRVLAMNSAGMSLLKEARKKTLSPIITKPAAARGLSGSAAEIFKKEAAATDFYVLAYQDENERAGGGEWRISPVIVSD